MYKPPTKKKIFDFDHNKKWYFNLKKSNSGDPESIPGMLNYVSKPSISGKFLVSKDIGIKGAKSFCLFETYTEFAKYTQYFPHEKRNFYEVMLGKFHQKLHFDLDVHLIKMKLSIEQADLLKDLTIISILEVFDEYAKVPKLEFLTNHLCLCTSHGKDKRSYHIIIDGYSVKNNLEAKEFFNQVYAKWRGYAELENQNGRLPQFETFEQSLDSSVYSKVQNFRILGSQKIHSGRIKIFCETFKVFDHEITHNYYTSPRNAEHKFLMQLESTLLSTIHSCILLPQKLPDKPAKVYVESLEIDESTGESAFELLRNEWQAKRKTYFPFSVRAIEGALVVLSKNGSYDCLLCNKIHDNENPFLIVKNDRIGIKEVFYHCRRAEKSYKLGDLNIDYSSKEFSPENAPKIGYDVTFTLKTLRNYLTNQSTTTIAETERLKEENIRLALASVKFEISTK